MLITLSARRPLTSRPAKSRHDYRYKFHRGICVRPINRNCINFDGLEARLAVKSSEESTASLLRVGRCRGFTKVAFRPTEQSTVFANREEAECCHSESSEK